MSKKPIKQPSKIKEHLRSIAIAIGLIGFGVSVTYIIMSQTTPLREELKESRNKCSELLKENEELKKKEPLPLNENIAKENANLKYELNKKNVDYNKLKANLAQVEADNKLLSSKMNNISIEYNRLKKNEEEEMEKITKEYRKLGMLKEPSPKPPPEQKEIYLNSTTGFYNNSVFITIRYLHNKDKITAIVHSSGYQEMKIDEEVAGRTFTYNSNKIYEIRIMSINPNHNNGAATFLVSIK